MSVPLHNSLLRHSFTGIRSLCTRVSTEVNPTALHRCKLLIVGGGTGGCSVAWRFVNQLKSDRCGDNVRVEPEIIVLDPAEKHYNQPDFGLVAAGIKRLKRASKPLRSVLPPSVCHLQEAVTHFDPDNNTVITSSSKCICYDYLVVAMGVINDYSKICGLQEALDSPYSGVSTIYSPQYCVKTWCDLRRLRGGHALYTFPREGAKCCGAAQMITYLDDAYLRKHKIRPNVNITYVTGGECLFGVDKFARSLAESACSRGITCNCGCQLVEVGRNQAVFTCGKEQKPLVLPFNLLHVTPPMAPAPPLAASALAGAAGFLDVDKHTLQHARYTNVFGLGDCTNTPNSKTAAAIGPQSRVVHENLSSVMLGLAPTATYDGYGACAILTNYHKGILAEFGYDKKLMETFPFDQSRDSRLLARFITSVSPYLYWHRLIKGKWNGPSSIRKYVNPFGKQKS